MKSHNNQMKEALSGTTVAIYKLVEPHLYQIQQINV